MKKYTVGFLFDRKLEKVLLVHKLKPDWQKGWINGVGGKYEEGEDGFDCVAREVFEETGIETDKNSWQYVGLITGGDAQVEFFGAVYEGRLFKRKRVEKEDIEWFKVSDLPKKVIPNLRWLIPLTLEKIKEGKIIQFKTEYSKF